MFIGIDFDNTIVCYDQLFHNLALKRNLTPKNLPISKQAVRDHLREIGSEDVWIEMQGLGYGPRMWDALPYPGAIDLIRKLAKQNLPVAIVSHKTKTLRSRSGSNLCHKHANEQQARAAQMQARRCTPERN